MLFWYAWTEWSITFYFMLISGLFFAVISITKPLPSPSPPAPVQYPRDSSGQDSAGVHDRVLTPHTQPSSLPLPLINKNWKLSEWRKKWNNGEEWEAAWWCVWWVAGLGMPVTAVGKVTGWLLTWTILWTTLSHLWQTPVQVTGWVVTCGNVTLGCLCTPHLIKS